MFQRSLLSEMQKILFQGEVIILVGPRQVGKTTLINSILDDFPQDEIIRFNGDFLGDRQGLRFQSKREMDLIFSRFRYIVIDEAQKFDNIGNILKSIVDAYKNQKQIFVTGSSTLGILDQTTEPLTGRKRVFYLYPIAFSEIVATNGLKIARDELEQTLIYGSYPQVLSLPSESAKQEKLRDIVSGQLYRDILEFQNIKNPDILSRLLELLALRVGSEVSYHALAQILGVSQQTVEKYIDLLEKSFIIFRLRPYMSNKLKEVTKMKKIYFTDLGIRNTLLHAYQSPSLRTDIGALWENYFILERRKVIEYERSFLNQYFWRTKAQEEVDYLEVADKIFMGYECKWQSQRYLAPQAFLTMYENVSVQLVHRENYWEYLV